MLAAAERAGAQAGAQAGFAAYGYSVPWNGAPTTGGTTSMPVTRGGGTVNSFRGALQQQQGPTRHAGSPRQGGGLSTSGSMHGAASGSGTGSQSTMYTQR